MEWASKGQNNKKQQPGWPSVPRSLGPKRPRGTWGPLGSPHGEPYSWNKSDLVIIVITNQYCLSKDSLSRSLCIGMHLVSHESTFIMNKKLSVKSLTRSMENQRVTDVPLNTMRWNLYSSWIMIYNTYISRIKHSMEGTATKSSWCGRPASRWLREAGEGSLWPGSPGAALGSAAELRRTRRRPRRRARRRKGPQDAMLVYNSWYVILSVRLLIHVPNSPGISDRFSQKNCHNKY